MLDYYHQKIKDGLIDEPEDTAEILEEQQQIWKYIPLVRGCADALNQYCTIGFQDLCQQGYLLLAELTTKIDWLSDPKMISKYVALSIRGRMKDYVARNESAVGIPHFTSEYFDKRMKDVEFNELVNSSEEDNPEEQLLLKERKDMLRGAVAMILPILNEREFYVLWNCMLTDSPLGYREVATQFDCTKDSIYRDVIRLKTRLKGVLGEDLKA
jgi:RNA polymerase sigma factor (sigma-70 family)